MFTQKLSTSRPSAMHSTMLLAVFLSFVASASACGLMMGGGGGCCPSPCGCGRKKRSTNETKIKELSGRSGEVICNNAILKKLIIDNIKATPQESKKAIANAVEAYGERFVVVCAEKPVDFAIHEGAQFCVGGANGHVCHAFELWMQRPED